VTCRCGLLDRKLFYPEPALGVIRKQRLKNERTSDVVVDVWRELLARASSM
jgi:hypothetical protein